MTIKEILDTLGISGPNAVAGFGGGLVNVFFNQKMKPIDIVGAILSGAIVAVYLGPPAAELTHLPIGAACFFLGLGGVQLAAQMLNYFRSKLPGGGSTNAAP